MCAYVRGRKGNVMDRMIAMFRTRRRLTQDALAEMLGVHRVTVAKWESGKHDIPKWVRLALIGAEAVLSSDEPAHYSSVEVSKVEAGCTSIDAGVKKI